MRLVRSKGLSFIAGLLALGLLVYYGINSQVAKINNQQAGNNFNDASLTANPYVADTARPELAIPLKSDGIYQVDSKGDLMGIENGINQTPINIGAHLNADADPATNDTSTIFSKRDAGMFLEVEGDPDTRALYGELSQRNVGVFLDVDSEYAVGNNGISSDQKKVYMGEYLGADG